MPRQFPGVTWVTVMTRQSAFSCWMVMPARSCVAGINGMGNPPGGSGGSRSYYHSPVTPFNRLGRVDALAAGPPHALGKRPDGLRRGGGGGGGGRGGAGVGGGGGEGRGAWGGTAGGGGCPPAGGLRLAETRGARPGDPRLGLRAPVRGLHLGHAHGDRLLPAVDRAAALGDRRS